MTTLERDIAFASSISNTKISSWVWLHLYESICRVDAMGRGKKFFHSGASRRTTFGADSDLAIAHEDTGVLSEKTVVSAVVRLVLLAASREPFWKPEASRSMSVEDLHQTGATKSLNENVVILRLHAAHLHIWRVVVAGGSVTSIRLQQLYPRKR